MKASKRNENRPGYKKTKVGWIPEEWKYTKLSKLVEIKDGTHKTPKYVNKGIPFLRVTDIVNNLKNEHKKFISQEEHLKLTMRCHPVKGDILYSKNGTIGIARLIDWDWTFSIFVSLALLKIMRNDVYNQFLVTWLNSELARKEIYLSSKQGTVTNLHLEEIAKFRIALPPLPEQKKIAKILSVWDQTIDQVGKLIDSKQRLKKGLMQQLLTGRMRFPEFGTPVKEKGNLPEGWKIVKLGDVATISTGNKNNKNKIEGGKYPFFVRSQTIERINSFSYNGEAILVPGEGKIGKVIHYINGKFDFHQRVYKISDFNSFIYGLFLFYNLKAYFPQQARRFSVRMTADSLRRSAFTLMKFPYPPLAEQTRIAAVLSSCDREIELLKKKQEKLKEQKKGLMQKLLTGEIRVKI